MDNNITIISTNTKMSITIFASNNRIILKESFAAKGNAHQIRNIQFAIRNDTFLLSTLSQQLSACSSL